MSRFSPYRGQCDDLTFDGMLLLLRIEAVALGVVSQFRCRRVSSDRQNVKSGPWHGFRVPAAEVGAANSSRFFPMAKSHSFAVTGPGRSITVDVLERLKIGGPYDACASCCR
jgi:hypothetical protein